MAGLELRDVVKRYGEVEVLHRLSLAVDPGEFLTLLGPSGSGKTTVLRLAGGFTAASDGRILFDGADITRLPPNRRPFNTVFQDYALFPHMTVEENVRFGPRVQGRRGPAVERLVAETLEIVGLAEFRRRHPAQLSGGQKQRVALARAIVCEPKLILLDEPLAALDATLRRQMQVFLKDIQRRIATTFVFVTHDQDEAITMSDRIVVMNAGRIEQTGTPKELYHRPRTPFVAGFFGDNNLIPGRLAGGAVETALGRLPVAGAASAAGEGAAVLVAVRPEGLRVDPEGPIPARVEDVIFAGARTRLRLRPEAAAAPELLAEVPTGEGAATPERGARVRLGYDPARAVVVPGGDA